MSGDAIFRREDGRPLRVLFLGNEDNVNARAAVWSRRAGVDADLYLLGNEGSGRGAIETFLPGADQERPPWVRMLPVKDPLAFIRNPSADIDGLCRGYDLLVSTGLGALILAPLFPLPRIHLVVGSEIGAVPSYRWALTSRMTAPVLSFRWIDDRLTRFRYSRAVRRSLPDIDLYLDSFVPNQNMFRSFDLEDRVVFSGLAEDVDANRARVDPQRLARLTQQYSGFSRVFIWLSRLNFTDPRSNIYKGAERYLAALDSVTDDIATGRIALVIGRHGNDVESFVKLAEKWPFSGHIDWVEHLAYDELLTYLSLPNAVLFSEFGELQKDLTGIGRDAASVGTVTVSSADPEFMTRQYGAPAPTFRAVTTEQIAARMREIIAMPDEMFRANQRMMADYGREWIHYPRFLDRLYRSAKGLRERRSGR
jgi:hypothetical protein